MELNNENMTNEDMLEMQVDDLQDKIIELKKQNERLKEIESFVNPRTKDELFSTIHNFHTKIDELEKENTRLKELEKESIKLKKEFDSLQQMNDDMFDDVERKVWEQFMAAVLSDRWRPERSDAIMNYETTIKDCAVLADQSWTEFNNRYGKDSDHWIRSHDIKLEKEIVSEIEDALNFLVRELEAQVNSHDKIESIQKLLAYIAIQKGESNE